MASKWSAFPWVCFAMCIGVMGTALISPLYPLYVEAWQLQPSDVSLIYVVYMFGALFGLLFMGRLSNVLGFRRVMLLALAVGWVGTLGTLLAWNVWSLNLWRFLVGVASTVMVTSASVGLAELSKDGASQRISMITSLLIALGFGIGPLIGGVVGQWLPYPLQLTYIPTLVLGLIAFYVLWRLPVPAAQFPLAPLGWQALLPKLTWTSRKDSLGFALTCLCPLFAFGVFGLYASMAPLFLQKVLPWHGPLVSGGAISVILLLSSLVQWSCVQVRVRWCGLFGLWLIALSNVLLVLNFSQGSATVFALGVCAAAAGHGMSLLAGMSMVNRIATPETRAGLLSTYLVCGYVGSIVPMIGTGWIADHYGLQTAITVFGLSVTLLVLPLSIAFFLHPRIRNA